MAIIVKCPNPSCGKQLQVRDDLAGKTVKCGNCQQVFQVPVPEQKGSGLGVQGSGRAATAGAVPESPVPRPSPPDPLIGTKIAHYRIQSVLGEGGMGKVYMARNINLDKTCAIKILPQEFAKQDQTTIDRFIREARSAAAVEHPNVLPVQFVGKVGENYFIEMKYVDGGTLDGLLRQRRKLELKEAARMIRDVAAGLLAAHKKGIIHRDIKPTNVMLTSEGQVFVMDFGLAKMAEAKSALTQQGYILGTPLYMSPEQARGERLDPRSDIYSLGVMFYQLVTGTPPYTADSPLVILHMHQTSPIPDIAQAAPEVPLPIAEMIRKMMAKNPAERYQSCAEIVQELSVFLETGTPGIVVSEDAFRGADEARRTMRLGKRPSRAPSPRKPGRMGKPVAIGLVLVLVLALGAVGVYFATQRQRSEVRGQRSGTTTTARTETAKTPSTPRTEEAKPEKPSASLVPLAVQSFDDVYVTTAATGEKIPHPLSRKTNKQTFGDGTTIDVPEGMVYVPGGEFTMGEGNQPPYGPAHKVYLDDYFIGAYEVTNAEWKVFADITGLEHLPAHWKEGRIPEGKENHPVVNVSWEDIQNYCRWVSKMTGREVRLPSEAQWEKAASWDFNERRQNVYPWGNGWDPRLCNGNWLCAGKYGLKVNPDGTVPEWAAFMATEKFSEVYRAGGYTMPVGSFAHGKSAYGCYDMAGNVYEWCGDWYGADYYGKSARNNPQGPGEEQADKVREGDRELGRCRVLRGGAWINFWYLMRCVTRMRNAPSNVYCCYYGFRLVVVPWRGDQGASSALTPTLGTTRPSLPHESGKATMVPLAESAWDDAYIATAATGEKIPHPLSRKTNKQTLAHGTTVDVPEGMVYVPAGEFMMGEGESEHRVYLDAYFIGKYEVTNAEWKVVVNLAGLEEPLSQRWRDSKIPAGRENHPVVYVSWEDAQKYCEWVSKETGREVKLPTEAQWEKAARGPKAYIYPWGNQWDKDLCNNGWLLAQFGFRPNDEHEDWGRKWAEWEKTERGKEIMAGGGNTAPVGSFPKDRCFYGCYDMAGNVCEWCADLYMADYFKLRDARKNPEGPTEGEAEEVDFKGKKMKARLARGGCWYNGSCRSVSRYRGYPSYRSNAYGFRLVVVLSPGPAGASAPVKGAGTEGSGQKGSGVGWREARHVAPSAPVQGSGVASALPSGQAPVYTAWPFDAAEAARRQDETAKALGVPKEAALDLGNGVTLKVVLIPAGTFIMGTSQEEATKLLAGISQWRDVWEKNFAAEAPPHQVTVSKPFYMGVYEVTQEQYEAVMGKNPSKYKGPSLPAESLTWDDSAELCRRLSAKTGRVVRLPTEAEWEYACRAGAATRYSFGDKDEDLPKYANYGDSTLTPTWSGGQRTQFPSDGHDKTAPVGSYKPNAWGLYDMLGNVQEWCVDWHDDNYYSRSPTMDPLGPATGTKKVIRGGALVDPPFGCRSARRVMGGRNPTQPEMMGALPYCFGVRLVVEPALARGAQPAPAVPSGAVTPQGQAPVYAAWPFDANEAARRQTETAKALGVPKEAALDLGNGATMKLALIPAGKFLMGSPETELGRFGPEGPQHPVTISRPCYLGAYEVTQGQYEALMGTNPSEFKGTNRPVEKVSLDDALQFCIKASARTGLVVRLPTEAEWEYACRAGTTTRFSFGDNDEDFYQYGNYGDRTCTAPWRNQQGQPVRDEAHSDGHDRTAPVGSFKPNPWGLYDMHGNVWEWCSDRTSDKLTDPVSSYYAQAKPVDPQGADTGGLRVVRGGSWGAPPAHLRSAHRLPLDPGSRLQWGGFRVVVEVAMGMGGRAEAPAADEKGAGVAPVEKPGSEVSTAVSGEGAVSRAKSLGIPEAIVKAAESSQGLVVVAGPTGSGKGTTVIALMDYLNETKACRICTVSDPPFWPQRAGIRQVRIGPDVPDAVAGIAAASKQNPDVLFVAGADSGEAISAAVSVAEAGHMVIVVMHGFSPEDVVQRLVGLFPPKEQEAGRRRVASVLGGVSVQVLLRRADGKGRVAAHGVLIPDEETRQAIAEGGAMPPSALTKPGCQRLSEGIERLREKGTVTAEEAERALAALASERASAGTTASFDEVYVAVAATGEKIPHPLSKKTYSHRIGGKTIKVPEGMVYLPTGEFTMGEGASEHRVYLDAYFIGKYEVTNAEWKAFTDATGFTPLPNHWKRGTIPEGKENYPVIYVSWEDSLRYCEWVRKETGREVRLPTEAQWEKAARGPKAYIYPWGNEWNPKNCNWQGTWIGRYGFRFNPNEGLASDQWLAFSKSERYNKEVVGEHGGMSLPVGSFPKGKSFYGCHDMAGNVWEWCADWFETDYYKMKDAKRNPQGPSEEAAEEVANAKGKCRVLRGGSWVYGSRDCRAVSRSHYLPPNRIDHGCGFRVVVGD